MWREVLHADESLAEVFADDHDGALAATWLEGTEDLLATYFTMEDPRRLQPAEREMAPVGRALERAGAPRLRRPARRRTGRRGARGRLQDRALARVDFEQKALFQMRFYALALWRMRGQVPRLLQLMYLGDGQFVRYEPDVDDLLAMERKLRALRRGHPAGHRLRRLAAPPEPALRLVRPPGALPRVRRHPTPAPRSTVTPTTPVRPLRLPGAAQGGPGCGSG